jgi:hypothetical protein
MKATPKVIRFVLGLALSVLTSVSALATTSSQIQGTWKSLREYSKSGVLNPSGDEYQMKMELVFDSQSHFSLKHTLTAPNGGDSQESLYTGDYKIQGDQILARATALKMDYQGSSMQLALNPARLVLMQVTGLLDDKMTIQMAGEDLYIEFERVHSVP